MREIVWRQTLILNAFVLPCLTSYNCYEKLFYHPVIVNKNFNNHIEINHLLRGPTGTLLPKRLLSKLNLTPAVLIASGCHYCDPYFNRWFILHIFLHKRFHCFFLPNPHVKICFKFYWLNRHCYYPYNFGCIVGMALFGQSKQPFQIIPSIPTIASYSNHSTLLFQSTYINNILCIIE